MEKVDNKEYKNIEDTKKTNKKITCCKKCGTQLQKEDYVFLGYCENCYNEQPYIDEAGNSYPSYKEKSNCKEKKEKNDIKQVLQVSQELNIKCKITILITTVLLVLSITCICIGFEHKENYYQSDTYYTLNKHVYVGGDAYNYIINANYFTGYMTLGGSLLIASLICAKTTIEMIKERN